MNNPSCCFKTSILCRSKCVNKFMKWSVCSKGASMVSTGQDADFPHDELRRNATSSKKITASCSPVAPPAYLRRIAQHKDYECMNASAQWKRTSSHHFHVRLILPSYMFFFHTAGEH